MHLSPKERVGYVALGAILLAGIGFVGAQKLRRPATIELHETQRPPIQMDRGPGVKTTRPPEDSRNQQIVVHVAGAVKNPGIVSIPAGSRVYDAILAAGGPTGDANIDAVNLAAKAIDGTQILVPVRSSSTAMNGTVGGAGLAGSGTRGRTKKNPTSVIELNSATAEQLQSLPGIGPVMAQRVVDYRSIHGPFRTVEDLLAVQGFGKKRLKQVQGWLIVL